jgi:hypothetical protein
MKVSIVSPYSLSFRAGMQGQVWGSPALPLIGVDARHRAV